MDSPDSKTCTKCGETKPLAEYYLEKDRPRGCCKTCHKRAVYERRAAPDWRRSSTGDVTRQKNIDRERQRRLQHGEAIEAKRRAARVANPQPIRARERKWWNENADRINEARRAVSDEERAERNARRRADRAANPEKHLAAQRAYRERNRERINARGRKYYARHPEIWENARRVREARKAGVEHQPYTRREIYDRDGGLCRGCQKALLFQPNGFQIDHIVPISLGGGDTPANVQLMCGPCNRRKWATLEGQIHLPV